MELVTIRVEVGSLTKEMMVSAIMRERLENMGGWRRRRWQRGRWERKIAGAKGALEYIMVALHQSDTSLGKLSLYGDFFAGAAQPSGDPCPFTSQDTDRGDDHDEDKQGNDENE
ncbi:uncharacterized protein A4U43_C01F17030 [Asparagus officinalis]|uniref:Uncharacterized protein n=1 Tax=Asparagus officinalis TaxID=4686 RepID=A0A5P1FTN9_ASPOF|nr:uncharacterized protein A4U43_C01F17030 [Asparagus officinalis]